MGKRLFNDLCGNTPFAVIPSPINGSDYVDHILAIYYGNKSHPLNSLMIPFFLQTMASLISDESKVQFFKKGGFLPIDIALLCHDKASANTLSERLFSENNTNVLQAASFYRVLGMAKDYYKDGYSEMKAYDTLY